MKITIILYILMAIVCSDVKAQVEGGVVAEPDTRNENGYYTTLSVAESNQADVHTLNIQQADADRFLRHPQFFPNIETISLHFSNVTTFESMQQNRSLKYFGVQYSWRLAYLPEDITDLPLLENITFRSCGLKELPSRFFQSQTLISVCICYNNLKELPEIPVGSPVRQLYLDINPIDHLPAHFKNLQSLEALGLKDCRFSSFPNEILSLKNLKALDLSANAISTIPAQLSKLKKLERLYLIRTPIKSLPRSLRKSSLKTVFMSASDLSEKEKEDVKKSLPRKCKLYWGTALNLMIDNSSCVCMKPGYEEN